MKQFCFYNIGFSALICVILRFVPIKTLFKLIKAAMFAGLFGCAILTAVSSVWFCLSPSLLMLVNIACNIVSLSLSASVFSSCYDKKSPF